MMMLQSKNLKSKLQLGLTVLMTLFFLQSYAFAQDSCTTSSAAWSNKHNNWQKCGEWSCGPESSEVHVWGKSWDDRYSTGVRLANGKVADPETCKEGLKKLIERDTCSDAKNWDSASRSWKCESLSCTTYSGHVNVYREWADRYPYKAVTIYGGAVPTAQQCADALQSGSKAGEL